MNLRQKGLTYLFLILVTFFTGGLKMAHAQDLTPIISQVKSWKLKNGLTVLFYPYHREDVVTVRLCVKVGSVYEKNSEAGITHLIEHMIFKGTKTRSADEIAGAIEELGGYMNAFTSYDYTCYFASGPSQMFKTAMEVLSDAVFHPAFPEKELKKEKEVVLEEMKMRLDNPMIVLFEDVMKATYKKLPYFRPIIGYEKTVKSFSRKKLLSFVKRFYSPSNMVLTIVGNLTEKQVKNLVNKFFAPIPSSTIPEVKFPEETFNSSPRLVWVKRDVKEGYFVFTLPGVSFKSEDAPLLDLLAEIIGGGETSRLYLRLKRELGLVNSISAASFTPLGKGILEIYGTCPPKNFEKVLKEVVEELKLVKENGVSEEELNRAKTQVLADFIYSSETAEGLSSTLSSFQLLRGNYEDVLWYEKKIESATPQDIKRVANEYLNLLKLTAGFLSPEKEFSEKTLYSIVKEEKPSKVEVLTLKNGLKVIMYPIHDIPTVAMSLVFKGGLRFETPETDGLFQALSLLWTRGTKDMSAEDIAEKAESLGGSIKGFSGRNTFGLKAVFLSSKVEDGLKLFEDVALHPSFSETEVKKARGELISMVLRQQDQPISLAVNDFLKLLFPNHPYGLNIAGSIEFYENFTSKDLKNAYEKFVSPKDGVLAIVGDFDPFTIRQKVEELFGNWKPEQTSLLKEEPIPEPPKKRYEKVKKDTFQTQILLGFEGPGLDSKERFALEVLNAALSGQKGRLFKILREEKGLAYATAPFLVMYPKASAFVFYIGCSPDKEKEAIEGFWNILEDIQQHGLTKEEIKRAKNRLIGSTKLSLQSNISIAEDFAVNQVLGLGWDYSKNYEKFINSVTQKDIKEVIKKYLTRDKAVLFVLGR